MAIDNYPYGMFNGMEYIYDSAKYAVEIASYSDKPIYTLLQCYARHTGPYMDPNADADDLYLPTGNTMHRKLYPATILFTGLLWTIRSLLMTSIVRLRPEQPNLPARTLI